MKYLLLSMFLFLIINSNMAQVVDYSAVEQTIEASEYNGNSIFLPWDNYPEIQKGIEGQIISDFENNEYTVIEYKKNLEGYDSYTIKNNKTEKISILNQNDPPPRYFYILDGLQKAKELLGEITFNTPLKDHYTKTIVGYNGKKVELKAGQTISISDLSIGLFGKDKTPYFAIEINNEVIVRITPSQFYKLKLMKQLLYQRKVSFSIEGKNSSRIMLTGYSKIAKAETTKQGAIKPENTDFNSLGKIQRGVANQASTKDLNKRGKVVFNICINREGKVVYAKYNRRKSSLTDRSSVSDALTTMKKTTFQLDPSAPSKECGQWTIDFSEE